MRCNQTFNGIPVLLEDWEFGSAHDGRLMAFGADARRVPAGLPTRPRIDASAARAHDARRPRSSTLRPVDPKAGRILFYPSRARRPRARPSCVSSRRPWRRLGRSSSRVDLVDTQTGAVVWRKSAPRERHQRRRVGVRQVKYPDDGLLDVRYPKRLRDRGGVRAITDSTGHYSATPPASPVCVTASLSGAYCRVVNNNGSSASMSQCGVANGSTLSIFWAPNNNSTDAERDAYYHVNWAHF